VHVEVLEPIIPDPKLSVEEQVTALRERTRAAILNRLGEPDRG